MAYLYSTSTPSTPNTSKWLDGPTASFCSPTIHYSFSDLRSYRFHHHAAARRIQSLYRGYNSRYKLWSYGGTLMVSRVVILQRYYRGHLGRKRIAKMYRQWLDSKANNIIGVYRVWRALRLVRIKRADRNVVYVIKIQCAFRARVARAIITELRRKRDLKACIIIQRIVRGYLGRRRCKSVKFRISLYKKFINDIRHKYFADIKLNNGRVGIDSIDISCMNNWEILNLIFCHIVGTRNLVIAYELSFQLKISRPKFSLGSMVFKLVQLLIWVGEGKAQVVREDYLQNIIGSLLFEKNFNIDMDDDNTEYNIFYYWQSLHMIPPDAAKHSINNFIDPVSRFHYSFGIINNNSSTINVVPSSTINTAELEISTTTPITMNTQDETNEIPIPNTNNKDIEKDELDFMDDELDIVEEKKSNKKIEQEIVSNELDHDENMFSPYYNTFNNENIKGFNAEILNEIEFFYITQVIKDSNKESWILAVKAFFLLLKHNFASDFGADPYVTKERELLNTRVQNLLREAKKKSFLSTKQDYVKYIDICNNIFTKLHKIIGTKVVRFDTCTIYDYHKAIENSYNSSVKTISINAHVDIIQAGGFVVVTGNLIYIKKDPKYGDSISKKWLHNLFPDNFNVNKHNMNSRNKCVYIAPLVLSKEDIHHIVELSINFFTSKLKIDANDVRGRGQLFNLIEYLIIHLRLSSTTPNWSVITDKNKNNKIVFNNYYSKYGCDLKFSLPSLEYNRRARNSIRGEAYSTILLQKCYRGFKGRMLYRRLIFKKNEILRQQKRDNKFKNKLEYTRIWRYLRLCKIQAIFKGYSWRKKLSLMKLSVILIQKIFRGFRAKLILKREILRKLRGPDVLLMWNNSYELPKNIYHESKINKIVIPKFNLIIYRCGHNYRLVGLDIRNNKMKYEGFVYKNEIESLIDKHNNGNLTWVDDDKLSLKLWHYERIVQLLIQNIGIIYPITPVTQELGYKNKCLAIVIRKDANVNNPGTRIANLNRILEDQREIFDKRKKKN